MSTPPVNDQKAPLGQNTPRENTEGQNSNGQILSGENPYWFRNLLICLFGSFTTFLAMTLMLPFLPLYVQQLGAGSPAAIAQWSGIAYGATFLAAGLVAPLWGHLGDRYGRKIMLVRASLGMAITMALMGCVTTVWQLVALRLLAGFVAGYSSGAMIMVAAQAPKNRSSWALGLLSSGLMAGNLTGPLVGGFFPSLIGIRWTFFAAAILIFIAFLVTVFMIREEPRKDVHKATSADKTGEKALHKEKWTDIPDRKLVFVMLGTGTLLMIANMSIEPIITLYVRQIVAVPSHVIIMAGFVMSAAALGSILSASGLGHLADKAGQGRVITGALFVAGLCLIPQAFVTAGWQLVGLRFLMGLALGGVIPCVTTVIRHHVPQSFVGLVLGYSISAQYAGQVLGPLLGGFAGGHVGLRAVFFATSVLLLLGALCCWVTFRSFQGRSHPVQSSR